MKLKSLLLLFFALFLLVSCASDDDEEGVAGSGAGGECVTVMDCMPGFQCINSHCVDPNANSGDAGADTAAGDSSADTGEQGLPSDDTGDSESELPGNGDSDADTGEQGLPDVGDSDSGDTENPGDVIACPDACSGFGECDFSTGKCTCDAKHQGDNCSECLDGYHLEAVDDDEDGDGTVSCAPNITCNPNPCNNNGCKAEGSTVKCTCQAASNHTAGRWCDECEEGYIKSLNDGKCKPDCSKTTCPGNIQCGIDYFANEVICSDCAEGYSGADCKSCDVAHFCSGHATSCMAPDSNPVCTCAAGYAGSDCSTCASGYFLSNGVCIKECDVNKCFKSHSCSGTSIIGIPVSSTVAGHGTCNAVTGGCDCDPGWLTGSSNLGTGTTVECAALVSVLETLNNVECTVCDKTNPPAEYATDGCPADCPTLFCNNAVLMQDTSLGSCYYEPTGNHRLYCKCNSGYTVNGDVLYYDSNPATMCASESGE